MILAQAGSGLLLAALALTSFAAAMSLWGARVGDPILGWVGRRAFSASAGCVAAASGVLLTALITIGEIDHCRSAKLTRQRSAGASRILLA